MDKVIFIDRDGVINQDPMAANTGKEYITDWTEFHFLPGVLGAFKKLAENGYGVIIISNQAGVGKGIYTQEKLDEITRNMLGRIEAAGGRVHSVQYCVHTKEDNCDCRKPNTGLFKKAIEDLDVDFKKTYFIGDTKRDIEAGEKIGCRTILVLSGKVKGKKETAGWEIKPDLILKNLEKAVEEIIRINKEK
jgi:histidinol-phosphate phosphatase family protein